MLVAMPRQEDPGTPSDQSEESTDDEKPPQFPQTLRDPDVAKILLSSFGLSGAVLLDVKCLCHG